MKVIFIKDSPGQGRKGEVKEVSEGFARNYLIAKGLAEVVTPQLKQRLEKEERERIEKRQREIARQQALKSEIERRNFSLKVKVGDKGQIFGGVHEKEIAGLIASKLGTEIEKNQIVITQPIKAPGEYSVSIKLGSGVVAQAKINLMPES